MKIREKKQQLFIENRSGEEGIKNYHDFNVITPVVCEGG